jgi:hypothetical protein
MRNTVRTLAIIDLTFITIPLTFETINFGYLLGFLDPYGFYRGDCERSLPHHEGGDGTPSTHANDTNQSAGGCYWAYELFRKHTATNSSYAEIANKYSVVILIIFIFMGAVIESYLFGLIKRGVRDEVHYWCQKWWRIRVFLLLLVSLFPVLKLWRGHYNLMADGLYDLTKLYRVATLVVVRFYMCELERTVGVNYEPPTGKPKQGSIGQDTHLLD